MTKAVHETNIQYADKAGLKTVGIEVFAGATRNFSGAILKIKAAQPDIIFISVVRRGLRAAVAADAPASGQSHGRASHHGERLAGTSGRPRGRHRRDLLARRPRRALCGVRARGAQSSRHQAFRLPLDHGPHRCLPGDDPGDRAGRRRGPREGRGRAAQTRRDVEACRSASSSSTKAGLSQIVSYTHQMQKGEPVVVWPADQATGKMIWPSPTWR